VNQSNKRPQKNRAGTGWISGNPGIFYGHLIGKCRKICVEGRNAGGILQVTLQNYHGYYPCPATPCLAYQRVEIWALTRQENAAAPLNCPFCHVILVLPQQQSAIQRKESTHMYARSEFPVLEFDDAPTAKLNPQDFAKEKFGTDKMVITFFPEVLNKLENSGKIVPERTIHGENPFTVYRFTEQPDVLLTLGQVGCPACAGNLDEFHAMGITKAMFCGGGGVLDRDIEVGQILVVDGAVRDEGFSYQYIAPSRVIHTDPEVTGRIARYLDKNGIPYLRGLTWTTDAIFRETADRICRRKEEGAMIVEMEQAGCIAVAQFRSFAYGALIYGGDDLSGEKWSKRGWNSREGIRYDLVMLCKDLVGII